MRIFNSFYLIIPLAAGLAGAAAYARDNSVKVKEVPVRLTTSIHGKEMFQQYCAVCHGTDGKGNGPAVPALKRAPNDLTQLTRKNNGKYPALAVLSALRGDEKIIEHGTVEMPMWGQVLSEPGQPKAIRDMRINALLEFVQQIQVR